MGFFDKLTDYVNTKGKDLDKSIKTFTTTTKLQGTISEKEDQIAEALKTIGQMYFNAHVNDPNAEYADQVSIIIEAQNEIEKIKKELDALKGVQRCPGCGESVSVNASFCPKCGTKMPKYVPMSGPDAEASSCAPESGNDPVEEMINTVTQDFKEVVMEATQENTEEKTVE